GLGPGTGGGDQGAGAGDPGSGPGQAAGRPSVPLEPPDVEPFAVTGSTPAASVTAVTGESAPIRPLDRLGAPFPLAVPLGERRAADVLPALVAKPWKQLKRAVDALGDDPPDEALHEVRILAKRMRYAAEAVAGVIGKPARLMASAVAEVQGVLGDMQDAVVAETWLRQHVTTNSSTAQALVAGQLVMVQRQQQAASRQGWAHPWRAASRRRLRAWLKAGSGGG
ncbi:MAG: CHAD domain-containing protein, partial [Actinomycetota bacterium]|nr:CHAD domain-containing protein [Actinomycetota bacterium]